MNPEGKPAAERSTICAPLARPVCDEWGFYDPEQAGLEAVMRKLASRDEDAAPAPQLRVALCTK